MQDVIDIGVGVLCVIIIGGGFYWQHKLFEKDEQNGFTELPLRVMIPLVAGALLPLGGAVAWVLVLIDDRSEVTGWHAFARILVCLAVWFVFNIKNTIAPIFLAASLSWTLWVFAHYGEFSIIPIVTLMADWVTNYAPAWVGTLYTGLVFVYTACSSIYAYAAGDALT